jgi:hypothetical protein
MLLKKTAGCSRQKYNSIVWKHFKDFFSVRKLFYSSDDISFVLNIKISAVKEYIFLGFIFIDSRMFYEIYKGYQTRKNKKQSGEKQLFEDH